MCPRGWFGWGSLKIIDTLPLLRDDTGCVREELPAPLSSPLVWVLRARVQVRPQRESARSRAIPQAVRALLNPTRNACWPFFFFLGSDPGVSRRGNSGGVHFPKQHSHFSHASHLTGKCLCKSAVRVSRTQGGGVDRSERNNYCSHAPSCPPVQIPHSPGERFLQFKMYPGDVICIQDWIRDVKNVCVCVCSLTCPRCITKERVTHAPSSF